MCLLTEKITPYGEYITEQTINNVSLNDIKSYYSDFFTPANAYMVVSGDVKSKDVKKIIKKYFGSWIPAKPPVFGIPSANDVQFTQINFVDMPNAVQSELAVMNIIDLKMADEDYHAALITNYIFGGAFSSYINMNLREKNGYTYGASSSTSQNKWTRSTFRATTKVRNAVTDSAVVEILNEMKRIRTEFVSDEDLSNAKAKYLGNFIMATENPQTIASYAINVRTQNLPADFYENFISKINAVTKEDVQRIANKYFKLNNARIVVVGKGSEVLNSLENITYNDRKIPVFYFDKYGQKINRPSFNKPIPEGASAQNVLKDYIEAIGGEATLSKINSIYFTADAEVQGMNLSLETKKTAKNQWLQEVKMMGNTLSKQVYNNGKGYAIMQGMRMDLEDSMLKALQAEAYLFPEKNYLKKENLILSSIESINGEDAFVVKISDNKTNYYSVNSGLKIQEINTQEVNGQTISSTISYNDYRAVNGILIPYTISQNMGPQTITFTVTDVKVNTGVSDSDFN